MLALSVSAFALASCATAPSYAPGHPSTPPPPTASPQNYDARIIRDNFGVPHIYGKRNADVAYGLAYAHAEDDWKTIEEVIRSSRGTLAEIVGDSGAKSDDFILALGNTEIVNRDYDAKASPKCKGRRRRLRRRPQRLVRRTPRTPAAPAPCRSPAAISSPASSTARMSFYGLEGEIDCAALRPRQHGDVDQIHAPGLHRHRPTTSSLAPTASPSRPSRSADGHTRLAANSHQPYEGRVAWYEARLKSEEGIDLIGGLFPGTPIILTGVGPNFGWAVHRQQAGPVRHVQACRR